MANRFARYVEQAPANRFAKYSQPEPQDEPAREPDTSFFREPVSVGGRVGVGGEPVFNSVGATGKTRLRLDEDPPAEETPEQARLKRDSAWIDETMRQFTSREGIDALHAEARAAGVPLGRAVRWKRNQLERQAKAGSLQPPETPSLSMADVNEQSTRERAGAIEFADELRGRIGQWPNTGEGEDPELFSALEVIEQYRKQVAPEVPGPRFMRQLFPREMAQQQERDPNGSWSAAGESLLQSIKQTAAGGAQALGERLRYAGNYIPAVRGLLDTPANFLRTEGYEQGAEALARMNELGAQMAPRPTASVYDDPEGWARYFGQQGVASSGLTLAGMGASLVNPALGAATFLGGAGGSEYGRARIEDGASPSEAGVRALTSVATEGIPEMLGGAAMLGRLPLMGLAQSTARGRAAIAIPTEAGTEGLTEKLNIEAERARGKYISPEEESARIKDAVVIGGMLGGGVGTGSAAIESGARSLQGMYEFAGQAADLTRQARARATTERILGRTTPPQTPQEAQTDAGAGIAEAAIQNALAARPVVSTIPQNPNTSIPTRIENANSFTSPVAQSDMRENDELDRLLVGALGGVEDGQTVSDQLRPDGDTQAGVRSAVSSVPVDLPDGTYFIPGDPAAIRQRLADAGVEWRGMERTIDGQTGVRFGANTRGQVLGVVGGDSDPVAGIGAQAPSNASGAAGLDVGGMGGAPQDASSPSPAPTSQPTQAEAAVDDARGLYPETRGNGSEPFVSRQSDAASIRDAAQAESGNRSEGQFLSAGGQAAAAVGDNPRAAVLRRAEAAVDAQFTLEELTKAAPELESALSRGMLPHIDVATAGNGTSYYAKAVGTIDTDRRLRLSPTAEERKAAQQAAADIELADSQEERDAAKVRLREVLRPAAERAVSAALSPTQRTDGAVRDDILSALPSVQDQSPAQRVSAQSLGADYTDRLLSLMGARKSGAMTEAEREEYTALLEQDRETGKVGGRPMVGIGNKTAYVDALMQGKLMPVQVFLDADNFKALNDKFGHDVGDDAIRLIADVVRAEFGDGNVFHRGGDEFLTQGMTQEEVDAKMARVQDYLARVKMELPLSDGRTATLTGVGVSYGTGANEKAADDSLKQDKQRRKDAGLRFDRREGDDAWRVGSESAGAGTETGRTDSRDSSRAAAEGVGDVRTTRQADAGGVGARGDSGNQAQPESSDAQSAGRADGVAGLTESTRTEQAESGLTVAEFNAELARAYDPRFPSRLARISIIAPTWRDVPQKYRDEVKADGADIRLVAGFVASDGTIVLIPGNMQRGEGVGVTIHEVGVHAWMAKNPAFRELLSDFKAARSRIPAVEAAFRRAESVADRDKNGNLTAAAKATLDEEAFAYYVEQNWNAKSPLMTRIKDAIARLLNRLGIPTSGITDALMRQALDGMVQAARESADAATRGAVTVRDGKIVYHKAWHGSPHDFDKFRLDDSTIGTGEGAQAFGHGLYFAGREELGEHYRSALSGRSVKAGGKTMSHADFIEAVVEMAPAPKSLESAVRSQANEAGIAIIERGVPYQDYVAKLRSGPYARMYAGLADAIERMAPVKNAGRLYEVELAPDESDYLDWDLPLSEQSEKVRGVMLPLVADEVSRRNAERERMNALSPGRLTHPVISKLATKVSTADSITGQSAYESLSKRLGGDRQASAALHAAGIPGIRYLDGSSRGGKTGWRVKFKNGQYSGKVFDTKAEADAAVERGEYNMVDRVEKIDDLSHNFVIFDDSQVEVKAKYSRRVQDGRIRKTVAELTNAADSMGSWRDWYDRHDQTLRDVFGDDAELFQKLLSATSQAASVPANVGLALKAYRQLFSGEPFTGYLPAVIKNLDRVAASEALRGQKISEYGSASEGNAGAIAVDRHIAMLFFGTKSPNRKQVASAKNRIRAIAERLGWQPREVQAALWAYNQTLLGTAPEDVKSYDKLIEAARARIDALRASIGRGEDRGAREVSGTAGRDGSAERDTETGREQASAEVGPKYSRRADGGPESLRVVAAGDVVDGRTVREGVPNQSSIASSLDDYTILKGIREVPMSAFDKEYVEGIAEGRIDNRTQALADAIAASKEIAPLIVAYDADGAYIIEGGHRLDALIKIGAKSLPAMVVIDEANPPKPATREGLGAPGPRYSRRPDTIAVDGVERPTTDDVVRVIYRGTNDSGERIRGGIAEGTLFAAADEKTARAYAGSGGKVERIGVTADANILVEGTAEFARVTGRRRGKLLDTMRVGENLKTAADDAATKAMAAGYDALEFTSFKDLGIAIFNEDKFVRDLPESDKRIAYSRRTPRTAEQAAALAKAGMPEDNRTLAQRGKDYIAGQWTNLKSLVSAGDAKQSVFDRFHRMSAIEQDLGIPPERSAYISARLAAGLPSIMEGVMMYGAPKWENGVLTVDDQTVGLLDALNPVKDDVNAWLGWMVGRRARALKAQGRENLMTDDDIAALLSLANGRDAEFQDAALKYLRIKNAILDVAEKAGLIDPAGRAVWDSVEYIPFYRQDEADGDTIGPGTRKGLAGQNSGIRSLKGGKQNLADPLGNIVRNFTRLIDASLKNNAMLEAVDEYGDTFFEKVPMSGTFERVPLSQVKKVLLDRGVPQSVIDQMPQGTLTGLTKLWAIKPPTDDDVVRVMRNGKAEYYRVPDKDLLAALTAFKVPAMHWALSPFKFFKKLLTVGVTSSPDFMARNFVRDSLSSWVISDDKFRVGWDSVKGVISPLLDDTAQKEMMFAGGSFIGGQFYSVGSEEATANAIRRALRDKGLKNKDIEAFMGTIARTPLALWDKWQKVGSYMENANRNAIYENAIKAGRSKKEAAYLARDLMDFSMHGNSQFVQFLSDVLPFFNARLQGLYKLYRQGGKRALRKALLMRAGMIAGGTMALMAWNLMMFGDGYDELEEWDKDTYWHIAPGTEFHIRVPKPFELGVLFATIPERVARAITYQVPGGDAGDRPRQTLDSFLTQLGGTLAMNPIPQGVMPIVEQWANKSFFTGRPIENMGDEKLLPEARAEWYTSDTAKVVSDVIGNKTGLSPKRIEHLWNGYTGTIGAYLLDTTDALVRQIQGAPERPELAWSELPLFKAFYRGDMVPKNTRYMTDFYELKTKAEQVSGTIKEFELAGRKDEAAELEAENAWLLGPRIRSNRAKAEFMHANVRKINKARDELADIRKQIEGIVAMPGFTDERKRREIDALAIKRNEIAREITRFLRSQERQSR